MSNKIGRKIVKQWAFRSSVDKSIPPYTVLLYDDGTASCTCAVWRRKPNSDGTRSCKHLVEAKIIPASNIPNEESREVKARNLQLAGGKHGEPCKPDMKTMRRFDFD